jgi:hypothetical protein
MSTGKQLTCVQEDGVASIFRVWQQTQVELWELLYSPFGLIDHEAGKPMFPLDQETPYPSTLPNIQEDLNPYESRYENSNLANCMEVKCMGLANL